MTTEAKAVGTKRQNFNITPEQEAELAWLQAALDAPSIKDTILRAVRVVSILAQEARRGRSLYVGASDRDLTRLLIPELETGAPSDRWQYLVERPHSWRRQIWVKGRLLAATVWRDMTANGMSPAEAAENWDLPREAVDEIVRYCEGHQPLLKMEADEERRRLTEKGVSLKPATAP